VDGLNVESMRRRPRGRESLAAHEHTRALLFLVLSALPRRGPTGTGRARGRAGHLSLARACKMTFTTSACPGRCPQEVHAERREKEKERSARADLSTQRGVSFDSA